jgi:hypothetical protein
MSDDQMPSAASPLIMRAIRVGAFGGIEQLNLSSIPVPTPGRGEVLVRVRAAGVGPWDALVREEGHRQARRKGRRLCGAKTRAGGCCQVRAEPGKARCRFHVGKSTGPKTEAGRNRIAEAQRLRWRHYRERDRKDSTS